MLVRSAFYVDGFNMYHAIADLNEPFLKWCNLSKLAWVLIPKETEKIVRIVYCTAFYPGDERKRWRHDQYINALKAVGVDCVVGHYVQEPRECRTCGSRWDKPTEKETDINVALSLYHDASKDAFDKAYLITADSDQAATAKFLKANFPDKPLVTVAPPGRNFSTSISRFAEGGRISISRNHLDLSVFPELVTSNGRIVARRPREYTPPAWWVHPDARPFD